MSDPSLRARSFGAAAADYHRARTGYTVEDVTWALGLDDAPAPGDAAPVEIERLQVLDLAAGTGRLTMALLAAGVGQVAAVEPDPGMRAEFGARVGTAGVTLHDGTAEAIPLPDASVDAVVVGSAFHWFDPERAMPQIARVLRPGGWLTALWTHPDEQVDWVRAYRGAGRAELATNADPAGAGVAAGLATSAAPGPDPRADRHSDIPPSPLFTATERRDSPHTEPTDRSTLVTGIGTYSEVLVATSASRAATLAAVADAVQRVVPGSGTGDGDRVLLPVRVAGARCRRRRPPG